MKLEGKVTIAAPRAKVWNFLTDAEAVSRCTPGLESLEVVEAGRKFRAVASLGLGSVKTRFQVEVEWVELFEPERARARAHGTAAGSTADVEAEMVLTEMDPNSTVLTWNANVTILGTIATLASRMMGGVTQKLSGQFFDCVRKNVEG
jgi:carbon monoxide dehydrogenase subunit G